MIQSLKFSFNPLGVNTVLLYDSAGCAVIIDPACDRRAEFEQLDSAVSRLNLSVQAVINTHAHFDHLLGLPVTLRHYGSPFYLHPDDGFLLSIASHQAGMFGIQMEETPALPDRYLSDDQTLEFGDMKLKIIHVPGHSPGGVAIYLEDISLLIAGDILFYGSIGRSDLPGGDHEKLVDGIRRKLLVLPDETRVICGHGQDTTIGQEKKHNPFLKN